MERTNMWIMYHEKDVEKNRWFIDTFIKTADKYNVGVRLVTVEQYENNEVTVEGVQGVVARMINPEMSVELEKRNIRVFNSSKVSYICNNKAETIRHAAEWKVAYIPTIIVSECNAGQLIFDTKYAADNNDLASLIHHVNTYSEIPCSDRYIIKSVTGHGGQEVMTFAEYIEMYGDVSLGKSTFGEQENRASKMYTDRFVLQPVIKNEGDVRVYVINGEIIGAVKRSSETLKSNYSLGGKVCLYQLTDNDLKNVKKITDMLHFDYAGIDFLLVDGKLILNEIEDVAGARMLSSCSDINYIELYIKYLVNACNTRAI